MKDATIDLILQAVLLPFADASVRTLVTCGSLSSLVGIGLTPEGCWWLSLAQRHLVLSLEIMHDTVPPTYGIKGRNSSQSSSLPER